MVCLYLMLTTYCSLLTLDQEEMGNWGNTAQHNTGRETSNIGNESDNKANFPSNSDTR
jgi:hypothetical protein